MTERVPPPKVASGKKGKGKRWRKKIKFWAGGEKSSRSVGVDDSSHGISSATSGTQTIDPSFISQAASMPERKSPPTLTHPTAVIAEQSQDDGSIDVRVTTMPAPQSRYKKIPRKMKQAMLEENSTLLNTKGSFQSSKFSFPFLGSSSHDKPPSVSHGEDNIAASGASSERFLTVPAAVENSNLGLNRSSSKSRSSGDPFDGVLDGTPEEGEKGSIGNMTMETLSTKVQLVHEIEIEGQPSQNQSFTGVCVSLPHCQDGTISRNSDGDYMPEKDRRGDSSHTTSSSLTQEEDIADLDAQVRELFRQKIRMAAIKKELGDDQTLTSHSYKGSLATYSTDMEEDQTLVETMADKMFDKINCCCPAKMRQFHNSMLEDDDGSTLAEGTLADESWTRSGTLVDGTVTDESWTQNGSAQEGTLTHGSWAQNDTLMDETATDGESWTQNGTLQDDSVIDGSWTRNGSYETCNERTMSTYEFREEKYNKDNEFTDGGESSVRGNNAFWGIFSKRDLSHRDECELTDDDGGSASLGYSIEQSRKSGFWSSMFRKKKADSYYASESETDSHTDGSHIYMMMTDTRRQKSTMDKTLRENDRNIDADNSSEDEVLIKNKFYQEEVVSAFDDQTDSSRIQETLPQRTPTKQGAAATTSDPPAMVTESPNRKMNFKGTDRQANKEREPTGAPSQERWLQLIRTEILKQGYKIDGGANDLSPVSSQLQRREAAQAALRRMLQEVTAQKQSMGSPASSKRGSKKNQQATS